MLFCPLLGEGSPTKIDCNKKGALILTSLLEDLGIFGSQLSVSACLRQYYFNCSLLPVRGGQGDLPAKRVTVHRGEHLAQKKRGATHTHTHTQF